MPKVVRAILRVTLGVLVVLASGELFERVFVGGPSPQRFDPEIGYSYLPGAEIFQTKEGRTHLRLNSLGLNDVEPAPEDGRCRVLVVGDSYTASLQVPQNRNFTSVAEQLDTHLDVVDGGRDGLFLGDMHKVALRLAPVLQPDLIVYVISERAVDTDISLPGFEVVVDPPSGQIVDAIMQVEQQETLKRAFGPLMQRSALATRLAAQLKPVVQEARTQLEVWRKGIPWMESARSSPDAGHARAESAVADRPPDVEILEFVFRRFAASGPAALLYINGLSYRSRSDAQVAETSRSAELLAERAATRAGVSFYATGNYLVDAYARTGQPPFGFHNALLPGGHLNLVGQDAVGHALTDLMHDMAPKLAAECGHP